MSIEADNVENELTTEELLKLILIELKISNEYNARMHEEKITHEDIDNEHY